MDHFAWGRVMEQNLYSIYTRDLCAYCDMAKEEMKKRKLPYTEYNVESYPAHKEELKKLNPKARTVPQIFVGKTLIGGYMEFIEYCENALGANVDNI